jgi:hypothetical protein
VRERRATARLCWKRRQLETLSGIGDECKKLKNLLAESETGMAALRKKQQQEAGVRCKADTNKDKEKDARDPCHK